MKATLLVLMIALVVSACGTVAGARTSADDLPAAEPANDATEAAPEPIGDDSADDTALPGDPAHGAELFQTVNPQAGAACSSCHRADSDVRLVGPGLLTVAERAAGRVPGMSAEAYLRESIVDPGAFVVGGYINLMPKTFAEAYTEQEINDLVAYLLTLGGEAGGS